MEGTVKEASLAALDERGAAVTTRGAGADSAGFEAGAAALGLSPIAVAA
jgi:hypothetical protein